MTEKSLEEGDVAGKAITRQARQRRFQWVLWVWMILLTVGLAADFSLRYVTWSLPPTAGEPRDIPHPEKPVPTSASTHFVDLFLYVKDGTAEDGHIPLMEKRGNNIAKKYQSIMEDGLYFLCAEVTLKSKSKTETTINITKRSGPKDKEEPILEGHIVNGTSSTGFLGRILPLEAGSQIYMSSSGNLKLSTVNVSLSFIAIYKLDSSPAP